MKRLRWRRNILLLLFVLSTASVANAKGALGTLAGTVTDARGKPAAGATVTIQTSDGLHPHATHADADGRFQFTRFRSGQYDLRAYAGGAFSDWSKRVVIHNGKTTEIVLRIIAPNSSSGR